MGPLLLRSVTASLSVLLIQLSQPVQPASLETRRTVNELSCCATIGPSTMSALAVLTNAAANAAAVIIFFMTVLPLS